MRALTNGEGEEEEAAASAGAGPGFGRKRRRAEQRGAQRARAAEARGAGWATGVLRHDPRAQPGRATLRSSAQVAGHGAGVTRRSPSPLVKVVSFVDSPVGGAERADDAPSRLDISRDQANQPRSAPHSPLPVSGGQGHQDRLGLQAQAVCLAPIRLHVRWPASRLAQVPGPVYRPTAPVPSATALSAGRAKVAKTARRQKKKNKGGGKDGKDKGKKSKGKVKPQSTPG